MGQQVEISITTGPPKLMQALGELNKAISVCADTKQQRMECFARVVISKGFGSRPPCKCLSYATVASSHCKDCGGTGSSSETWQQVGKRLYGDRFVEVMRTEVKKRDEKMRETE